MIVVIQCAATKNPSAGHMKTSDGKPVMFVANPQAAPARPDLVYARPDDLSDTGVPWRRVLLEYNEHPGNNPFGLRPAHQLYKNKTYERLTKRFGLENVFSLSAGWGLISATFLTPQYDITFSAPAEAYKRRGKREHYSDLCMLPETANDVVFLGGKDYLPLFCALSSAVRGRKTVFYNSRSVPDAPGCKLERFETSARTNWHYECANALISGALPKNVKFV